MIHSLLFFEEKSIIYQAQNSVQMNDKKEDSPGEMKEYSTRENVIKPEKKSSRSIRKKKNIQSMIKKYGGAMIGQHETMEKNLILMIHFLTNLRVLQKMSRFHPRRGKTLKIANTVCIPQISKIATWLYQILLVKISSTVINEMDQKIVSIFINPTIQNTVIRLWM